MITRAAAYARYSTSRQHETSIEAQLLAIEQFCQKQGWQLVGMPYIDEAKSGTNTNRGSFKRLVQDARLGRFDVIVIYDLTRGARDVADWFAFRKEMEASGIRVVSATGGIGNLRDPNDFLQESIQATVGQFVVMQSRQKSIAGKNVRARRGLLSAAKPSARSSWTTFKNPCNPLKIKRPSFSATSPTSSMKPPSPSPSPPTSPPSPSPPPKNKNWLPTSS